MERTTALKDIHNPKTFRNVVGGGNDVRPRLLHHQIRKGNNPYARVLDPVGAFNRRGDPYRPRLQLAGRRSIPSPTSVADGSRIQSAGRTSGKDCDSRCPDVECMARANAVRNMKDRQPGLDHRHRHRFLPIGDCEMGGRTQGGGELVKMRHRHFAQVWRKRLSQLEESSRRPVSPLRVTANQTMFRERRQETIDHSPVETQGCREIVDCQADRRLGHKLENAEPAVERLRDLATL